ncbi:hypothetical protein Anapl_08301 [Anas platyrhynchos]|uniref:Uncharacterized protein n=1 Tax=Anas platyrhynchos TaxID=8839 RepID=R0JZL2_ANAPL|nr:hypothetical protein Anapl_08301 [Anas platyrhynchos]
MQHPLPCGFRRKTSCPPRKGDANGSRTARSPLLLARAPPLLWLPEALHPPLPHFTGLSLGFTRLHRGVLRDLERQHQKKENIRLLEEQIALTKQLKEERDKMLMEKGSQQS